MLRGAYQVRDGGDCGGEGVVPGHAELRVRVHGPQHLQPLLLVGRRAPRRPHEGDLGFLPRVANDVVLDLVGVPVQGLHHHQGGLERALQPLVVPVEAVHGAGDVDQQPQPLRLLLRRPRLGLLLAALLVDRLLARDALDQAGVVKLAWARKKNSFANKKSTRVSRFNIGEGKYSKYLPDVWFLSHCLSFALAWSPLMMVFSA